MAALYKRYIPPPTSAPSSVPQEARIAPAANKQILEESVPKLGEKRKRERSAEEVAQRKAKKLQKKGVEVPLEIANVAAGQIGVAAESEAAIEAEVDTIDEDNKNGPLGDFSHVKNIKKRHKLEKEARKARKTSEKIAKEKGSLENEASLNKASASEQNPIEETTIQDEVSRAEEMVSKKSKKRRKDEKALETSGGHSQQSGAETIHAGSSTKEDSHSVIEGGSATEVDVKHDRDISVVDSLPEGYDQSKSQPKKRRHRLEATLQINDAETEMRGNEEEHLQNHTGVIEKFQKATKARDIDDDEDVGVAQEDVPILHDLVPLPQPDRAPTPDFHPDYSDLPLWLAIPHVVTSHDMKSFADLHLDARLVEQLDQLGLRDALPVQQAVLPLLLSPGTPGSNFRQGSESVLPDLAVSAATGSGKTLSYLLPIIEAERHTLNVGRLKALIVVPTRELVLQVAATAESLTKGTELRVGTSTGAGKFRDEQEKLIYRTDSHNPTAYARLIAKAHRRNFPPNEDSVEYEEYLEELEQQDTREEQLTRDTVSGLIDHVPVYNSAVNILICTPGRLLEHISNTLGFSLAHLQWLVLDEADKLLDEQYNGFLETLNTELTRERKVEEQDAREQYLRCEGLWKEQLERRVRKVMLSATMTRDISKLMTLKLRWPRLLIVRDGETEAIGKGESDLQLDEIKDTGDGFELPFTLTEYCAPVGDGSEKPLILMELLKSQILPVEMTGTNDSLSGISSQQPKANLGARSDSESSSDSDVSDSSDEDSKNDLNSDAGSEPGSASDSSSTMSTEGGAVSNTPISHPPESSTMHPARAALLTTPRPRHPAPTILIFTSSAESALRLSHLLTHLQPSWTPWLTTLTKTSPATKRRLPNPTSATSPSITISTDRSARGLDALSHRSITHVLQYDVPRSVPAYVHRVGRTARAGRPGEAWTLYTHSEAAWFLKNVAKTATVRRKTPVEKVRLEIGGGTGESAEALRERYADVLAGMREMVHGSGRK